MLPFVNRPMLILIAGPYRSGTNDEPAALARNLAALESAAWPIFQKGHVPLIGEWVALPVMRGAGSKSVADEIAAGVLYPTAQRLLHHCDAVLRLPGASTGADEDVRLATERGLPVYRDIGEIPTAA